MIIRRWADSTEVVSVLWGLVFGSKLPLMRTLKERVSSLSLVSRHVDSEALTLGP